MRSLIPLAAFTLCVLILMGLGLAAPLVTGSTNSHWVGYTLLLVKQDVPWREALAGVGLHSAFALEDAMVDYTTFRGLEAIPLVELDRRFDPLDPRLDNYMTRLRLYFEAGDGWRIVYVKSKQAPALLRIRLRLALKPWSGDWQLADRLGVRGIPLLLVGLGGAVVLIRLLGNRRRRIIFAIGWTPWIGVLVAGAPDAAIASILLGSAWILALPGYLVWLDDAIVRVRGRVPLRLPRGRRIVPLLVYIGIVALLLASGVLGRSGAAACALAALGWPIAAIAALSWIRVAMAASRHRLFVPLRLVRPWPEVRLPPMRWLPVALVMLASFLTPTLLSLLPRQGNEMQVPAPVPMAANVPDSLWGALEHLWEQRGEPALPNLAEYVAHIAFQHALPYGRPYGFPEGSVRLTSYTQELGRIVRHETQVLRFDEIWAGQTLSEVPDLTVERMLLDQGKPVEVHSRSLGSVSPRYSLHAPTMILLFVLLVLFSFDSKTETVVTSQEVRRAA